MAIAYLTSEYPAVSHTFIAREIAALRRGGLDIVTFSVRPPTSAADQSAGDAEEMARTFYLRGGPASRIVAGNAAELVGSPLRYAGLIGAMLRRRTPGVRGLLKWLAYLAQAVVLARECRRLGVTHIHNHFANASANVAMLAAEHLGVSWSFTLHGIVELEWDGVGRLENKVESARFVACVCDFNRAHVMRVCDPSQWHKVHVVRCGLDLGGFAFRAREGKADSPLKVLCVSRFSPEKGLLGLIQAVSIAVRSGSALELILVGDGPSRPSIEAEIERLGLKGVCRLAGAKRGVAVVEEYANADVVVLASFMEGLPVSLMEGMSSGAVVVAPRVAGIPELVIDDKTGLLFSPGRWDQLAECLVRLSRSAELRGTLAAEARLAVETFHDVNRSVVPLRKLLGGAVIDDVSSDGSGGSGRESASPPLARVEI